MVLSTFLNCAGYLVAFRYPSVQTFKVLNYTTYGLRLKGNWALTTEQIHNLTL